MHKRTVLITSLVGASGVAVCVPDIKAYRRLAAIARSIRDLPIGTGRVVGRTGGLVPDPK